MRAAVYNNASANFSCRRNFAPTILNSYNNKKNSTSSLFYKRKTLSPNASQKDSMRTVENIHGCRINQLDPSNFRLEFLASFEGSSHSVWVPSKNVAEDIRRKFSREWWALCREEKKSPNFSALMEGSGEVLVKARDMKNRSLKQDCEGYTSLHIAAGYLNTETVEILLRAGADPEVEDDSGRSVDFRSQGYQESWVSELDISDDLIRDYNDGFEFANCKKIFCSGKRNELLVQWKDTIPPTWEPKMNVQVAEKV
ncbi:unnamed protein product [Bathycoccus prasinos]